MPDTPEECLAPSYTVNTKPDWDAEHMGGVQKCSDDTAAAFHCRRPTNCIGNAYWISRLEHSIWAEVKVDADVG